MPSCIPQVKGGDSVYPWKALRIYGKLTTHSLVVLLFKSVRIRFKEQETEKVYKYNKDN